MSEDQIIASIKAHGKRIGESIAEVPNYPDPGVSFKDITPVLQDGALFSEVNGYMTQMVETLGPVDLVLSPESRGFLFGPVVADRLQVGFVPARKPGKLPRPVIEGSYMKEYGRDMIQIHADAIRPNQRVVIVDDVLATGGTAKVIADLVERAGGVVVGFVFFIALNYLEGVDLLGRERVLSVVDY